MKDIFTIRIGQGEEGSDYKAVILSCADNKITAVEGSSLRQVLARTNTMIRKRHQLVKNFPMPEPSRIINPNAEKGVILVPR